MFIGPSPAADSVAICAQVSSADPRKPMSSANFGALLSDPEVSIEVERRDRLARFWFGVRQAGVVDHTEMKADRVQHLADAAVPRHEDRSPDRARLPGCAGELCTGACGTAHIAYRA